MNKGGTGHVEVIISFVLFIGFLAFILIAFNPLKPASNPAIVNSIYNVLEENLSTELNKVSINLNFVPPGKECFILHNTYQLVSDLKCNNQNILIKDKENHKKYAQITAGEIVSTLSPTSNFYTIYCSDEIDPVSGSVPNFNSCKEYDENEYGVGIIVSDELWSLKKITSLENEYTGNYPNMKKEFIRETSDFGFIIWDINLNKEFDLTQDVPKGLDVISKTLPINIVNSDANVTKHTITVMTW
ncbi:hypothetical protein COU56_03695 [Candidatus Pacearchaeota archaeon CG10_big_fil_rev_8_21_14_0_10_31_9]|nr:MAG: hypothetical protein AUJ62_03945 [Candidatus Pacearchaeota archaeon CG1_02_32_21]PIN93345.1 MAG: hypothetical protein COU56_03695 [Candidatus Pacearchaeota archaeon CG10_big_fil_rev_8_21_14_0_10_31_9]PIZ82629.1 MAG: hypothetical protein COX97_03800 [Candidatus Pacearchaeota archaeon CG_4_10_14_0_2_um_filter_05_32_18]